MVANGCNTADFNTNSITETGLTFEWEAFKFKSSSEVYFTVRRFLVIFSYQFIFKIQLDMCDPQDNVYCKGATSCAAGIGNSELFDSWVNSNSGNRKRRRSEEISENDTNEEAHSFREFTVSLFLSVKNENIF